MVHPRGRGPLISIPTGLRETQKPVPHPSLHRALGDPQRESEEGG